MSIDSDTLLAIVAVCLKKREERHKRKKRLWMKNIYHNRRSEYTYEDLLNEMKMTPGSDFRHFFVSNPSIYEELLELVGPLIKKKDTLMRDAIPVGVRLSTTLRFLASENHFEGMKSSSLMSSSAISRIVLETCEAIISRLKNYMKLPKYGYEWESCSSDFNERWQFPNCLGVVGGKHIAIVKPNGTNSMYYNYKNFFSIVLMAVVNANYEFLAADIDISTNTSGLEDFFQTSFGKNIKENFEGTEILDCDTKTIPYVFVGDSFQLNENLMVAFSDDNLTEEQQVYNYHLSRAKQVLDNTFGALSAQFKVLQKPIYVAPEKVKTIVLACCYLYNYLRMKTEFHNWDGIFDSENFEDGVFVSGSWREFPELTSLQKPTEHEVSINAKTVRESFVEYFNNAEI